MKHSISQHPNNIRVHGGHVFNGEKWIGSVERAEAWKGRWIARKPDSSRAEYFLTKTEAVKSLYA